MAKPKIVALSRKNSGVTYHRIEVPLKHLEANKEIDLTIFYDFNEIKDSHFEGCSHFIISRFIPSKQIMHVFEYMRKRNIKVIVDQDDHWELPNNHPMKAPYEKYLKTWIELSNQYADEVWVTHKELAKHVKNKRVAVIPNGINHHDQQWKTPKIKSDELRFGYVGGISHKYDLLSTKLDFKGSKNAYCVDVDGYPNILNVGSILDSKPTDQYAELYSHFDVSLIPLQANSFTRCKSNLKMLEAGFTGTAAIVSNVYPYTQIIKEDNCLVVPNNWDWTKTVSSFTKDMVEDLAGNLKEDVWEYRMDKINEIRYDRLCQRLKK